MIKNKLIKLCNITLLSLKNYYNLLFEDIKMINYLQSIFKYLKLPTSNFIIKRYIYKLIIKFNIHITLLYNKYSRLNKFTFLKKRHQKFKINHFKKLLFYTFILYNIKVNIKKNNSVINNRLTFFIKITKIFTFFRNKYYNNYDLIMQIKNILLLYYVITL